MGAQWKRLAVAALMSLSCAGATVLWYKMTERPIDLTGSTPLAQVSSVDDEVLRRPSTRLLWLPVNTGDNLYTGETIRTSSRGELSIQLLKGGSLRLEPDSLIVLQESKGQISLNLMEGSLFVDAKKEETAGKDAPKLVLSSANGEVDLTGSSASLSKGSSGKVDLQVLSGTARIKGARGEAKEISSGKSSTLDANGTIFDTSNWKVLSPTPGAALYVDVEAEKPVEFRWMGLPGDWSVRLLAGDTKKNLKEVGASPAGSTSLGAKLPLGKFWWKLVAQDNAGKVMAEKASSSRLEILAHRVPAVFAPLADSVIPMEVPSAEMTFRWEKPLPGTKVQLEVASDPLFTNKILTRSFQAEDQHLLPGLRIGTYYWRMSVSVEGEEKSHRGKTQKFTLEKPQPKEMAQLTWTLPQDKLTQTFTTDPSLELEWQATNRQNEILGYKIRLENQEDLEVLPLEIDAKDTRIKAKIPKPGRYVASIEAYDKEGAIIGRSAEQILTSKELPLLPAPRFLPETGVLQSGFDGRTELKWEAINGAKTYTLTVMDKEGKTLARKNYSNPSANLQNLMPGEYVVQVEVIDQWGRSNMLKEPRTLVVPDRSNLKAPSLKKIQVN